MSNRLFKSLVSCQRAFILLILLALSFTSAAAESSLCVKSSARVARNGSIKLGKLIRQVDGPCPARFRAISLPAGPAGEQGARGPVGPQGPAGSDGQGTVVNISTVRLNTQCSINSYSGNEPTRLCLFAQTFDKLEQDSILEIIFHGTFLQPFNLVGAVVYQMRVDGQDAIGVSNSSVGGPARFTLIASQGTYPDRHHGTMHGVFENIPAQAGLQLEMLISGFTASDEGGTAAVDPGNAGNAYAIVREILVPN